MNGIVAAGAVALLGCAVTVSAQTDYPTRPPRIVVPYAPGGGVDILARVLSEKLSIRFGQPVPVDNRAGAAGNVGAEAVFRSPPDGYALLFTAHPPLVVNKALFSKLTYDPDAFTPVSMMATSYSILLVHPKVPVKTLQEFLSYTKANPGKLNYASQGAGTAGHLYAESLSMLGGIKMVHVPYKGGGPALAGLVAGDVEVLFGEQSTSTPFIRAGKLRALGYGGAKRHPELPDVPAVAETLPRFLSMAWYGMVAPPGTPAAIVNRWAAGINEVTRMPDVAKRMADMGFFAVAGGPQEMAQYMKEERERWSEVIRFSGAKED